MEPIRVKNFIHSNRRIIGFCMRVLKMNGRQIAEMLDPDGEERRDLIATLVERISIRYS